MELSVCIKNLKVLESYGPQQQELTSLCFDSRKAAPGSLFVAQKGTQSDGHQYIDDVIAKGAKAIVLEDMPAHLQEGVSYIKVADTNAALGLLASAWFGEPSTKLTLVGVTGTNGKTTIATLLYHMFRSFGFKVGLLSTVCNYVDEQAIPSTHTTPDAYSINSLMAQMVEAGCQYAFMEVSSHSIAQERIAGLRFAGGIFTNLTHDHLDYHKTFDAYLKAKKTFFDNLPAEAFALTNIDDRNGMVMLQNTKASKHTYSTRAMADFRAKILETHLSGMQLEINGREVFAQFIGRFNVSNLLAVYGAAILLGRQPDECLLSLSRLHPVAGRLEYVPSPKGFVAIVDYAHTPDALHNVLETLKALNAPHIISVVGAGGNRDKTKRPEMAAEACALSDTLILTSDNPRFEEPQDILNDMYAGIPTDAQDKVLCILDRREAIRTACRLAQKGDLVLVAGKGHENYQEIKGVKHHFDDKEELEKICR